MTRSVLSAGLAVTILLAGSPLTAGESNRPITIRGALDVVQEDDFAGQKTRRHYRVTDAASGRVYELLPNGKQLPERLRSGMQVVARGQVWGAQLDLGAGTDGGVEVLADAAAATAGSRGAVVLVVDFADSAVSCSDASIDSLMWTGAQSVDGLYQASSYAQLSLPADTDNDGQSDVFRVSIPNSVLESCDAYGWAAAAESAATGSGVDLGLYQHRVIVLPSDITCGWAGLGNVGCGSYCRAWVKTCQLGDVYAHEIGHNLEMAHASTDENNDGVVDCEYCDRSDPMGYGGVGWRFFNGAHDDQMGWMPPGQMVEINGSGTSTHVLSALTDDPAQAPYPQVLKVYKADSGDYYYLTYRMREGYDANLNTGYSDRTSVHRYVGSGYQNTLFIQALGDSQTFEDTANGLVVTQLSHDADTATLQISTECAAVAPSVALAPVTQLGIPGDARVFTLSVTNNDPALCDVSTLDIAATAPAGWTASLSTSSFALAPGAQGQATLQTTSPIDQTDGNYLLTVDATDPVEANHQGSGNATYQVDGTPPDAASDLAASIKRKTQVQLAWSAPFDAGSGVDSFDVYRDGTWIASTAGTNHTDRNTSSGDSYSYHVIAIDAVGNRSSASNLAEITVGGGGGGGGGSKGGGGGGKGGGSREVCDDGVDNDADGQIDCSDSDCRKAKVCR